MSATPRKYRYADAETFKDLNLRAIALGRNRSVDPEWLESILDEETIVVCIFSMTHEHQQGKVTTPHRRCLFCDGKGHHMLVDVETDAYEALEHVEIGAEA